MSFNACLTSHPPGSDKKLNSKAQRVRFLTFYDKKANDNTLMNLIDSRYSSFDQYIVH